MHNSLKRYLAAAKKPTPKPQPVAVILCTRCGIYRTYEGENGTCGRCDANILKEVK